jgi:hypothetical protein
MSDMHHSGWPTTVVTQALVQCADELIQNVEGITTTEVATELSVSKGSVDNINDAL